MKELAMLCAAATAIGAGVAVAQDVQQTIELRTYSFSTADKLQTFAAFTAKAFIPALNRAGVTPVGVFRVMKADNPDLKLTADDLRLYVLIPHISADSAMHLAAKLNADAEFMKASESVLGTPMKDPVYDRYETQLMLGFAQCPRVLVPAQGPDRLMQMRIYESHNEERAARKIEMFNGAELALFRKLGLMPVFFGQSVAGTKMPNLTYMLGFPNETARDAAWKAFLQHPDWLSMKADAKFKDTVSNITNMILRPVDGSQI
jgi:hypothetical protein